MTNWRQWLAGLMVAFIAGTAGAQTLTIGTKLEVNTLDPHFFNGFAQGSSHAQIFDALTGLDENLRLVPGLATQWRIIDDTTWEFTLRRGVRFHDGSEFNADDVIATYNRVPNVPNSPNSFAQFTRPIAEIIKVDDYTLRFRTRTPYPTLAHELARVFIISRRFANASTNDFNSRAAAIGTGPYRVVEWVTGDRLVLERNDAYWGGRPQWARVTERVLLRDSARLAALLTGEVDAIDEIPSADLARLRADSRFAIAVGPAAVVHYIALDSARDDSPFVGARDGAPALTRNPLRDTRVRRALSLAINRQQIVERVMEGSGEPAAQFLPNRFEGTSQTLRPDPFDPDRARALLREAGFGDGFRLTLHATADRYPRDRDIAQAIGQMWTRIGLQAAVEAVPGTVFFTQASAQRYSAFIAQYGTDEASQGPRSLAHTFDAALGLGSANRTRYSNTALDQLMQRALAVMAPEQRRQEWARVTEAVMAEQPVIPVFFPTWEFASRANLVVTSRPERRFNSLMIRPRS